MGIHLHKILLKITVQCTMVTTKISVQKRVLQEVTLTGRARKVSSEKIN